MKIPSPLIIELARKSQASSQKDGMRIVPPGKPHYTAVMADADVGEFQELRDQYHDIMNQLTYKQSMAWCRGFGFSRSTFLLRKYGWRSPSMEEVLLTIEWVKTGMPVTKTDRRDRAVFDGMMAEHARRMITEDTKD